MSALLGHRQFTAGHGADELLVMNDNSQFLSLEEPTFPSKHTIKTTPVRAQRAKARSLVRLQARENLSILNLEDIASLCGGGQRRKQRPTLD